MTDNTTQTWGDIDTALETPHSVITSVDTKLVYDQEEDQFEAVMVGDFNAFPEGLSLQSNWDKTGDLVQKTAKALVDQVPGEEPTVAINKPGHIYKSDNSAIIRGKNDIIEEIERLVDETYEVMDGQGLESAGDGSGLQVNGQPVDGYVNISDRATGLGSISNTDLEHGAQAPTAVWNEFADMGKISLLDTAENVTADMEDVHTPNFFTVESPEEIVDYFTEGNSIVLKADQYGTHGDDIVSLDWEEYQTALNRGWIGPELDHTKSLIDSPLDYIETKIENEERRVQAKGNRPDDFQLYDEESGFKGSGPGLLEEAVAGEYSVDGNTYTVVDRDDQPMDFVPVTIYNPETGEAEVESQLVRASATEDLNANRGFANFDPKHVEYAWDQGFDDVYEDGNGALNDTLEEIAGRPVSLEDEILPVLEKAGQAAYVTRNASSYNALNNRGSA